MRNKLVILAPALFLVGAWGALPVLNYKKGTAENIRVEVLAEPFIEGDSLVYNWSGDIVRSCAIELRRSFIDSYSVKTDLTAKTFGKLPLGDLGPTSYEVSTPVPLQIAEGPATYQVFEIPRCNWLQWLFPVSIPYPPVNFTVTRR